MKREDLFITSKLNNPYHHREHVPPMMEKTLKDLRVEYVDLYLMHWPVAFVYVPYDQDRRGCVPFNVPHCFAPHRVSLLSSWGAKQVTSQITCPMSVSMSSFFVEAALLL